jgi:hypothetical protein
MRLRQLVLALIALTGACGAVLMHRSHEPSALPMAVAAVPQPATPTVGLRVRRIPGLERPAAALPIVESSAGVHVRTPAPRPARRPAKQRATKHEASGSTPGSTAVIPQDTRVAAVTPPPGLEPLAIHDAQVVAITSSSARITWRTNVPTEAQTAFGLDSPTIWAQASGQRLVDHESILGGLEYSTSYQVYLHAVDEWNRAESATLTLTTGPMPASSSARTDRDHIVVDDRPFFPTAVWAACSDGFGSNIEDGINLFMGDGCREDDLHLPVRLDGRAYSTVNAENPDVQGRGVIGWYYPDEWDAFLAGTVKRDDLETSIVGPRAGRVSFLTLTNHFYSRAEPLPEGKGMYPALYSIPDVVGFDLYPLQVWCRPAFADVFDSQAELHTATGGKPTFQWVEVAPMEHQCSKHAQLNPNAATVRAETWLSIAGGADAVGYFPNRWSDSIGDEITRSNHDIKALTPALLAATARATSDSEAMRVSARSLNGALYVIAVNTTDTTLQAKISVEGIAGRSATVFGGGPTIGADDQGFTDSFGPLAARVYIVPPTGWYTN